MCHYHSEFNVNFAWCEGGYFSSSNEQSTHLLHKAIVQVAVQCEDDLDRVNYYYLFSTLARRDSTPFSPMQTLADFSHKIVPLKDPGKMKKPLFRLLYTVKMIFDVSTFYNRFIYDFS